MRNYVHILRSSVWLKKKNLSVEYYEHFIYRTPLARQNNFPVPTVSFVNSSLPGQNGRHFEDDIFKCIFMNEKSCILIQISLNFVRMGPIDNKRALVQVMTWHPMLPEPMLTQFTNAYNSSTRRKELTQIPENGRYFADDIFMCIYILIQMLLKFVIRRPTNTDGLASNLTNGG